MMRNELRDLSPRHHQIARLLVGGHTQSEIGRILGMHKSSVSRLVKEPLVAREISRLQEMADVNSTACVPGIPEKLCKGAHKALEVLQDILNDERNEPEMVKIKANVGLEILSRAGYGPKKSLDIHQGASAPLMTSEAIEDLKRRAREILPSSAFSNAE